MSRAWSGKSERSFEDFLIYLSALPQPLARVAFTESAPHLGAQGLLQLSAFPAPSAFPTRSGSSTHLSTLAPNHFLLGDGTPACSQHRAVFLCAGRSSELSEGQEESQSLMETGPSGHTSPRSTRRQQRQHLPGHSFPSPNAFPSESPGSKETPSTIWAAAPGLKLLSRSCFSINIHPAI